MKLLIRGGAIARGKHVAANYSHILSNNQLLNKLEINNISREDDNSFDAVWTFDTDIAPHKPDILLVHYGMNDAYFPARLHSKRLTLAQ